MWFLQSPSGPMLQFVKIAHLLQKAGTWKGRRKLRNHRLPDCHSRVHFEAWEKNQWDDMPAGLPPSALVPDHGDKRSKAARWLGRGWLCGAEWSLSR